MRSQFFTVAPMLVLPTLGLYKSRGTGIGFPTTKVLPRGQTPKHLLQPGNAAQHVVVSSERIRTELGYEDLVEIEEAIRRTIAWEQRNLPSIVDPQQFDYSAEDAAIANLP
ncbi:hypothetical protein RBB80_00405 [Tunturiibacter gelidiferens]